MVESLGRRLLAAEATLLAWIPRCMQRIACAIWVKRTAEGPGAFRRTGIGQWLSNARLPQKAASSPGSFDGSAPQSSASILPLSLPVQGNNQEAASRTASTEPDLDRVAERLQSSADDFSRRLEHASLNLLQSVEGMRSAAAELGRGVGRVEEHHARMETMFHHVEQTASRIAAMETRQQEQLEMIAAALHGITVSLTTVVASANESQATVAGVARSLAVSVERLDGSMDRLGRGQERRADLYRTPPSTAAESVTLRQVMEVQRQFINTLDDRLACLRPSRAPLLAAAAEDGSTGGGTLRKNRPESGVRSQTAATRPVPTDGGRAAADADTLPSIAGWRRWLERKAG